MRSFLSLLMAVAALSFSPARAWAEAGHGHCEETVAPIQAAAPIAAATASAELSAPAGPCGECPGSSCSSHRHCAAGTPPVVAEALSADAVTVSGSATGPVTTTGFAASFDPTPPTPPPNFRTL